MKTGYGTIYQFEFDGTCKPFPDQALYTNKGKVLILKKGYNATIFTIPYGQVSPVEIDYPTADDDIFYPLKGSSLSFKVLGGVINMDSLISEDEQEYFLEYYRGDNLFWSGFVSPELCEEDIFLRYPAIEFKTIDGLGTLKSKELKIDNKYPAGILSVINIMSNALKSIGYDYALNVLIKTWYDSHVKTDYSTPLEQTYLYTASLRDDNFQFKSNVDIVLDLCNAFNAFVYQNYGEWYIVKPKDLAFGVNQASKFSTAGVLNTSSKKTIPTLVHGTDFLIIAEPRRKIRRFYKYAETEYQYSNNKYINGDFTLWDGTTNPITLTDTLTLVGTSQAETTFTGYIKSSLGTPKTFLIYDALADKYMMGLTTSSATDGSSIIGNIDVGWEQGFNLSISTYTNNPSFALVIGVPYLGGTSSWYYNFSNDTWQTSPYVFKRSTEYPDEDIPVYSKTFAFPDVLVDWASKEVSYKVGLTLYAQTRDGYSGNESWYSQILLNSNNIATTTDKELVKIDNIKNASIIPQKRIVSNGDGFPIGFTSVQTNYSNFKFLSDGNYFSTVWPSPSILGPTYPDTGGWYEREEPDRYGINELATRNILNQYSDYRNIFTGVLIGKNLQYGAIYEFPNQGALNSKKFWPLSIKLNERDCTAEVVLMELSPNEITGQMTIQRYDYNGLLISTDVSESKKKSRNGVGTDLGEAGESGTLFDRFVAFFMDDFKP
jgi:hypothetical protein